MWIEMIAAMAMSMQAEGVQPLKAPPQPRWVRRPTGEDFARVYPEAAISQNMDGDTVIRCQVTEKGGLTGCEVVLEKPKGYQFDRAALALTPEFKMKFPQGWEIPPAGMTVTIPMKFRLPRR